MPGVYFTDQNCFLGSKWGGNFQMQKRMLPTSKAGQKWCYLCNYLVSFLTYGPSSIKNSPFFSNFHNGIIKKLGHFLQLNIMHLKDIITGLQKNGMVCRVPNYSLGDIAYGNLKITADSAKILNFLKL